MEGLISIKVEELHRGNLMFMVVAIFIKGVGGGIFFEIFDGIIPSFIVIKCVVKDGGVPISVTGPDDMREGIPFSISIQPHLDIG
jgi:hypothetical protein